MINEEYIKSLDDEIGEDVYYYHNQVNDKIDLYTVGCEISEWDGEKVARILNTDELDEPIIVFNTCAVTDCAQEASEKLAIRLDKIYPNKKKFFIGCGVNYNKEFYNQFGTTLTNQEKFNVKNYGCTHKNEDYYFQLNNHRNVGMVKIQDGCYNNCAYCIIHKIRPHYMVPYEKIHKQIAALLKQGKKNIQLLGTEIATYNCDGLKLSGLCEKILQDFPEIDNIVIGALDPAVKEIDNLIELMKREPRIYNMLYLCTQSCSDKVLKMMNRRHNVERLRELKRLAGDKIHLVFQLIVGFPGETDELFQETYNTMAELKPVDFDSICFSSRKGTDAHEMPEQVPQRIIEKRDRDIYDLVKSYTFEDDQNTDRSFATYEKNHTDEFNKYRPQNLDNCIVFHEDLYDTDTLVKLFKELPKYETEDKDVVIITDFVLDKEMFDFDVNVKLLTFAFGVKVLSKIKCDDKMLDFLTNTYYAPNVIMYRLCTYLEIDFDKLENSSKEDLLKLFKICYLYKIDDTDLMLQRLIKAGNKEYATYIMENFDVSL